VAKGYDATSVEEVAERAGVSRLIVYRHFTGKDDLYRSVLTSVVDQFRERLGARRSIAVVATLVEVARADPDGFRLLWRHARHEPSFAAEAEAFRRVAAQYADGILDVHDLTPPFRRWAVAAVVDHLHEGICSWLDIGDPALDDEFTERLRAATLAMVAAWS
jgi:AcrR family transcriptional regulator